MNGPKFSKPTCCVTLTCRRKEAAQWCHKKINEVGDKARLKPDEVREDKNGK